MILSLRRALHSENFFIVVHKSLVDVRKFTQGVMTLSNVFDPHRRVMSPKQIEKFFGSLVSNLQPMKADLELSSLSGIIVCNLFLAMEVGKLNLDICVKWIHGESLNICTKIFGSGLIQSSIVGGQLSLINDMNIIV